MNEAPPSPLQQATQQFYQGMAQLAHEARGLVQPKLIEQFHKRGIAETAEQSFSHNIYFHKRLHALRNGLPGAPIAHGISRFSLEYFCCLSALNLYRLPQHVEQFKCELLTESFLTLCKNEELNWLGVYDADMPNFKRETGHALHNWRSDIITIYLIELRAKSSRDADSFVAMRRFLSRQGLSKGSGVEVTPAMLESCALMLEGNAGWLERYLKFHTV